MTTLQPVPDDVVPEVSFVLDVRSPSVFAFSVHPAGNEGALVHVAAHQLRHAFARVQGVFIFATIALYNQT